MTELTRKFVFAIEIDGKLKEVSVNSGWGALTYDFDFFDEVEIPELPANTRTVASINLGSIGNPQKVWWAQATAGTSETLMRTNFGLAFVQSGAPFGLPDSLGYFGGAVGFHRASTTRNVLLAHEDYTLSERFSYWSASSLYRYWNGSSWEQYPSTSDLTKLGYTYSELPVPVMVGMYGASQYNTLLKSSSEAKVQCEGWWLEQSGEETLLKIAFFNASESISHPASNWQLAAKADSN